MPVPLARQTELRLHAAARTHDQAQLAAELDYLRTWNAATYARAAARDARLAALRARKDKP